jgi:hypothetical protein
MKKQRFAPMQQAFELIPRCSGRPAAPLAATGGGLPQLVGRAGLVGQVKRLCSAIGVHPARYAME